MMDLASCLRNLTLLIYGNLRSARAHRSGLVIASLNIDGCYP
jgi:hypothetical protein